MLLTPPLTPAAGPSCPTRQQYAHKYQPACPSPLSSPSISPDFALPPAALSGFHTIPDFELPEAQLDRIDEELWSADSFAPHSVDSSSQGDGWPEPRGGGWLDTSEETRHADEAQRHTWRPDMTPEQRDQREAWLGGGRGRRGLRIVIVTENFLPKVDGVTRTLARLLEHLQKEGHQCMLLGPETGLGQYASHPLVGTAGVPLVVYPGLKLNFLRPKFLRCLKDFQPDVVHVVDAVWLGAQVLMAIELGWAGQEYVAEEGPALGAGIQGKAVVASYHTNLATYATLFGMSWLTPMIYSFQRWCYGKTLLTLCPSNSTKSMLEDQGFAGVRIWPRGVDLSQFGPSKRCRHMRASWGVGEAPSAPAVATATFAKSADWSSADMGFNHKGRKVSLPLTPPLSPAVIAYGASGTDEVAEPEPMALDLPRRVVLLYVGRVSWEKNLHMLLAAYKALPKYLPAGTLPKLVFVGNGPAKQELEEICAAEGHDAVFMGHREGEELARCYASADVFAFPSFTETFGQVVLEALASGLPVIGLDAEGTRDLVSDSESGLLLRLPEPSDASPGTGAAPYTWPTVCRSHTSPVFLQCADQYASLLARVATDHTLRRILGETAAKGASVGRSWWDAMEMCVDGYREAIRLARAKRQVSVRVVNSDQGGECQSEDLSRFSGPVSPRSKRLSSTVNRVVSRRLAHRGRWASEVKSGDSGVHRAEGEVESLWHLKTLCKVFMALALFYAIYSRHANIKSGNVPPLGPYA